MAATLIRSTGFALLLAVCGTALAQTPPTPQALVEKMLYMAGVTKEDFVMDLGSGDGRAAATAARRGARSQFVKGDVEKADLSRASVIALFLLPELNLKLRPKLLALKPGTRIVSNGFDLGDWKPDETVRLTPAQGCDGPFCIAHLWIVPARVAGTYRHAMGALVLQQEFQVLTGAMTINEKALDVIGKVTGEKVSFIAGGLEYSGRVNGKVLELQ